MGQNRASKKVSKKKVAAKTPEPRHYNKPEDYKTLWESGVRDVEEIASRMGCKPGNARLQLRLAGVSVPRKERSSNGPKIPRNEVVSALSTSKTKKAAADELGLSYQSLMYAITQYEIVETRTFR